MLACSALGFLEGECWFWISSMYVAKKLPVQSQVAFWLLLQVSTDHIVSYLFRVKIHQQHIIVVIIILIILITTIISTINNKSNEKEKEKLWYW